MSVILSIETATAVCSVALHEGGYLLATQLLAVEKSHAAALLPMVDQLLVSVPGAKSKLAAVAISEGPGSYTGLRIGTATAKGLCQGYGVPLIKVNPLQALAQQLCPFITKEALLCPMIDARRMEVYGQLWDSRLQPVTEVAAWVIDENSFGEQLTQRPIYCLGDGADKCADVLTHPNAHVVKGWQPQASHMGRLAAEKFKAKDCEDLSTYVPFYLKSARITAPKNKKND